LPVSITTTLLGTFREQIPRQIGDGLRRDRDDHDLSGVGGVDDGNGRRADLGRQRGQAVRSSGVRDRDLMPSLGERRASGLSNAPAPMIPIRMGIPHPNAP
jgi:hypothetical protein